MLVVVETSGGYLLRSEGDDQVAAPRRGSFSAERGTPQPGEVFELVSQRGLSDEIAAGEVVSLVTAGSYYLSLHGPDVRADQRTPALAALFQVEIRDGSTSLGEGTRFSLRTVGPEPRYLVAEGGGGGVIRANRRQAGEWETFTSHPAGAHPFDSDGPKNLPRTWSLGPYASGDPVSRGLMVVRVAYADMPSPDDDLVTLDMIRDYCFGTDNSLRKWVLTNSFGRYDIHEYAMAAVSLPEDFAYYKDRGETTRWQHIARKLRRKIDPDPRDRFDYPMFVAFDFSDVFTGSKRTTGWVSWDANPNRGGSQRFKMQVISHGLYLKGGPKQGIEQLRETWPVMTHELGHLLFGLPDRYSWARRPARGDVIANRRRVGIWERFTLHVRGTDPLLSTQIAVDGDAIQLVCEDRLDDEGVQPAKHLYPERLTLRQFINAVDTARWSQDQRRERWPRTWFTISLVPNLPGTDISDGSVVTLRTTEVEAGDSRYVVAEGGGGREVAANREHAGAWEQFRIERVSSRTNASDDRIRTGDVISLRTGSLSTGGSEIAPDGFLLCAEPDGKDTDLQVLDRGWTWPAWEESPGGNGAGGGFDKMDDSSAAILLCMWDRARLGFVQPRFVTPRDQGCYRLRPSISSKDALLLWDPESPKDYYILENRQRTALFDEVPSSGVVISWTSIPPDHSPAVISAARTGVAPNPSIAPLTLAPREVFGRHDPHAAFDSGKTRLSLGNGEPSNFVLSFHRAASDVIVCVHALP